MSEEKSSTPHAELIAELMNPNKPKNEREHAAVREIKKLQEVLEKIANVNAMDYEYQQWAREALKQLTTEETV
jgi:hypothetical protein